jgi:hypothetical protein
MLSASLTKLLRTRSHRLVAIDNQSLLHVGCTTHFRLELDSMPTTDELVQRAQDYANVLEQDMNWYQSPGYEYWTSSPQKQPVIRARAITALDFLERFAGHDSQWAIRGHEAFDKNGKSMESGARGAR